MRGSLIESGEHPAEPSIGGQRDLARARARVKVGVVITRREVDPREIARRLSIAIGRRVVVRTYTTYAGLVDAVSDTDVDLAWLPPVAYVRARRMACVDLLATVERGGRAAYASALLGRPGVVDRFEDLAGKRAAWVDNWSAAGYLVPRWMMRAHGISPDLTLKSQGFLGSYDAIFDALASGAADVGASFCQVDETGRIVRRPWTDDVTILGVSEPIPGDTFCAAQRADAEMVEEVRAIVLGAAMTDVMALLGGTRLVGGESARYDALERELFSTG
jgi:phosphate/phosphite/phosphonate ABC transporter binding protein